MQTVTLYLKMTDRGPLHVVPNPGYVPSPPQPFFSGLKAERVNQISDGTSKTFLIGEYATLTDPGAPFSGHLVGTALIWGL